MSKDDGATKVEETPEQKARKSECMGVRAHKRIWVWDGPRWTDLVQCVNCGEVMPHSRQQA